MSTALASLARYRTLLDLKGIAEVDVVATAAARDAVNGPEFLAQIRALGLTPRLLSGEEEAALIAHFQWKLRHPYRIELVYFEGRLPLGRNGKFEEFVSLL